MESLPNSLKTESSCSDVWVCSPRFSSLFFMMRKKAPLNYSLSHGSPCRPAVAWLWSLPLSVVTANEKGIIHRKTLSLVITPVWSLNPTRVQIHWQSCCSWLSPQSSLPGDLSHTIEGVTNKVFTWCPRWTCFYASLTTLVEYCWHPLLFS